MHAILELACINLFGLSSGCNYFEIRFASHLMAWRSEGPFIALQISPAWKPNATWTKFFYQEMTIAFKNKQSKFPKPYQPQL